MTGEFVLVQPCLGTDAEVTMSRCCLEGACEKSGDATNNDTAGSNVMPRSCCLLLL